MIATDPVALAQPNPERPAARPKAAPFPSLEEAAPEAKTNSTAPEEASKPAEKREAEKKGAEKKAGDKQAGTKATSKDEDLPEPTPEAALPPIVELTQLSTAALPSSLSGSPAEPSPAGKLPAGTAPPAIGDGNTPVADILPVEGTPGEAPPTTAKATSAAAPPTATQEAPAAVSVALASTPLPEATPAASEKADADKKDTAKSGPAAGQKGAETATGKTPPPQPASAAPTPPDPGKSDGASTDKGTDKGAGGESLAKQPAQTAGAPKNSETTQFTQTLAGNAPQAAQISPHRTQAPLPLHQTDAANSVNSQIPPAADGQPAHTDVAIELRNDRLHIELATRDSLLAARLDAASGQLASDLRHVGSDVEAINVALKGQTASDSNDSRNAGTPQAQQFNGDQEPHGGNAHHPPGAGHRQAPGQGHGALHLATAGERESVDRYA